MYGNAVWHKWVIKKIQFNSPVQKFMDRSSNQVPWEDLKMSKRLILQAKWAGEEGFLQVSGAIRKAVVGATQDHMTAVFTSGGIRNPHSFLQVEAAHNTCRLSPSYTPRMEGINWSLTCKAYSLLLLFVDPLKFSQEPKSIRRRIVKEKLTYPLAFLSCLCLHSSPGGHQLKKKPGQNWIHPLPSTSLDSERKSWVPGAPRPSSWWVKADCKCTSLPLQRVWCVVSGGTPRLQGGTRSDVWLVEGTPRLQGGIRSDVWLVEGTSRLQGGIHSDVWLVGGTPRLQGGVRSILRERNLKSLILAPRDVLKSLACLHQTLLQLRGTSALPILNSQTK